MHSCSSSNFFYRDAKLRVLISTVNPITTISDLKVHNKTMISFVLESSRVLPGFKVITAQADSQVLLQSYMLLICFYLTLFLCQIFHQHLCLNISEHEHLTPKKLMKIIASHKENAKSPFIEDVQLNQRHIFADIQNVFSASASCTSQGLLLLLPAAVFFWLPAVTFFLSGAAEEIYSGCLILRFKVLACHQCCFKKCTETGYLPCRSLEQTLGLLPSRCKAWCMSLCDSQL